MFPTRTQIALIIPTKTRQQWLYNQTSPFLRLAGGSGEGRIGAQNTSTARFLAL